MPNGLLFLQMKMAIAKFEVSFENELKATAFLNRAAKFVNIFKVEKNFSCKCKHEKYCHRLLQNAAVTPVFWEELPDLHCLVNSKI